MKKTTLLLIACITLFCSGYAQQPGNHFDGKTWWDYVRILADDKMEGRETGSSGLRKAEAYKVLYRSSQGKNGFHGSGHQYRYVSAHYSA